VTGAAGGIGRELVMELAKGNGHRVIAVSRNETVLEEIRRELEADGIHIYIVTADLVRGYASALAQIRKLAEKVDILVNNAGILINKPLEEVTDEDIEDTVQANYMVPVKLCRDLQPLMGQGTHIINIGSMGGYQGSTKFPGLSVYSSSKGALAVFSECMAEEWKERGVAVNCLALGSVQTEMLSNAFPGYKAPTDAKGMAEWIGYFALEGNKWFNGKVLPVSIQTP